MKNKNIEVYDIKMAGTKLSDPLIGKNYTHVVSIGDPGSQLPPGIDDFPRLVMRQEFQDVNQFVYSYMGNVEIENEESIPKKEHVEKIIQFIKKFINDINSHTILIHCFAGISRSTAVALIASYLLVGDEELAKESLFKIRPEAIPNSFIIQYADEILGSNLFPVAKSIAETRIKQIIKSFDP